VGGDAPVKQLKNAETAVVLGPWTDGLREVDNPYDAQRTEIVAASRFDWFNGYLVKQSGLKVLNYDHQITETATPRVVDFLFRYNAEPGSVAGINSNGRELLIGAGTKLYAYNEVSRTPVPEAAGLTFAAVRFSAAAWHDGSGPALFLVSGADKLCKYKIGTSGLPGTATAAVAGIDGRLVTLFKERLWVWDLTKDATGVPWSHPNWGAFSARGDATSFNNVDIVECGADNESVQAVLPLEQSQLVLTDRSIQQVFGSSLDTISINQVASIGTVDGASVILVDRPTRAVLFLATDGYYAFFPDTGQLHNLSTGLPKSFTSWGGTQRRTAVYDPSLRCVRLLHNIRPKNNRTLFVTGLKPNLRNEQVLGPWMPGTLPIAVFSGATYSATDDAVKIVVGDGEGYLYEYSGGTFADLLPDGIGGTTLLPFVSSVDLAPTWGQDSHGLVKKQVGWLSIFGYGGGDVTATVQDSRKRFTAGIQMHLPGTNRPIWNQVIWNQFIWGGSHSMSAVREGVKGLPPSQGYAIRLSHSDAEPLILGPCTLHYHPLDVDAGV